MAAGTLSGVDELAGALQAWGARMHKASERGVQEAGTELREEIQANLIRREYPPASPPGEPPALRTGALRDSVRQRSGEFAGGYQERVYPSTVYARIHELSEWAGAGHRSFLPKRPYVGPALHSYTPRYQSTMVAAWRGAMPRR